MEKQCRPSSSYKTVEEHICTTQSRFQYKEQYNVEIANRQL